MADTYKVASLAVLAGNGAAFLTATNILAPLVLTQQITPSLEIALFLIAPALGVMFGFVAVQWAHEPNGGKRAHRFMGWSQTALAFSVVSTIAIFSGLSPLPSVRAESPIAQTEAIARLYSAP